MPLAAGDKLGPYEILAAIGVGGALGRVRVRAVGTSSWQSRQFPGKEYY
jgi:hypothetical protein